MVRLPDPARIAVILLGVTAIGFAVGSWRIGFWDETGPGPGLLPFITAAIMLPLLFVVWREPAPDDEPFRFNPLAAVILTAIYALVLPHLGFILPTVLLIVIWVRLFHRQPIWRAFLLSFLLVVAGTLLFVGLLKVPMPLLPAGL